MKINAFYEYMTRFRYQKRFDVTCWKLLRFNIEFCGKGAVNLRLGNKDVSLPLWIIFFDYRTLKNEGGIKLCQI